jgi:hypothetical protein
MPPRDPPSGKFLRGKAAEAAAREQADTNRLPGHRDFAGREITKPGPHVDPLGATEDDFPGPLTPVEHLQHEVAQVKAAVIDQGATLAERYTLPHTEAWQRLVADIAEARAIAEAAAARAKICDLDRERRGKLAVVWKWAKGLGLGGIGTALVWAVVMIGDAGANREAARADKAAARKVIDDLDLLRVQVDNQFSDLREKFAADHALLQLLVSRFAPP